MPPQSVKSCRELFLFASSPSVAPPDLKSAARAPCAAAVIDAVVVVFVVAVVLLLFLSFLFHFSCQPPSKAANCCQETLKTSS